MDAALTRLTRPAAPADPLAADRLSIPRDSPAIKSLQYMRWHVPADRGAATVAATEIQGACILATIFDLADPDTRQALQGANLLEHTLSLAGCSRVLHALHEAHLFESEYNSEGEFFQAINESSLITPDQRRLRLADIEATEPFDQAAVAAVPAIPAGQGRRGAPAVPAVAGRPAQPGPVELKGIQLTTWLSVLDEGQAQLPGEQARLLARAFVLLSHRSRDATRRDENSEVRTVANTLTTYVKAWAGIGRQATPAQVSRQIPAYLASSMSVIPADLAGPCGTALSCESEMRDGHTLLCGRESEAASVLWRRIHHNIDRFPVLDQFKGRLNSSGATKEVLERLMIGTSIPAGSPLVRTWELARDLDRRGKLQAVRDLFAAGSSVSKVVEEILESHVTSAGAATVPDSGAEASSAGGGGSIGGSMEQREFERAVTAPNFIKANETIQQAEGIWAIEAAATSGSTLMLRYLFWSPAWMRPRHAAFDTLGKHLDDRSGYLEYCITVSADTETVPSHLATYRLSDTQVEAFWGCRWSELDMVNANPHARHEGGFLAVRYLEHGQAYDTVAQSDFYTVESSLLGIREWFGRLLLGVGFSAAPDEGYSWNDVVDRQLELVRYLEGLPAQDRNTWRQWASDNFIKHALVRAHTLFRAKLQTSRPADEVISHFLPDGSAFFANITSKLEDAKPIAVVRRAFPNYFPTTLVSLPGTASSSSRHGGGGSSSDDRAKGKASGSTGGGAATATKANGGKGRMREQADVPGGKSDLAKVLASGHLFIAARVCDLQTVADHYKVKKEDYCWPVIFSTKKGDWGRRH